MNQLSWFLYLADVLSGLGQLLRVFGVVAAFGCVPLWIIFVLSRAEGDDDIPVRYPIILSVVAFVFLAAGVFCPSKETMYAIAASEMGEKMLQTPVAGKAEKALEAWLDKQIADHTTTTK